MALPEHPEKMKDRPTLTEERSLGSLSLQDHREMGRDVEGRRIPMMMSGTDSGSYISVPHNGVATYGNVTEIAD
jgi:hypothetical protein